MGKQSRRANRRFRSESSIDLNRVNNSASYSPERFVMHLAVLRSGARVTMAARQRVDSSIIVTDKEGVKGAADYLRTAMLNYEMPACKPGNYCNPESSEIEWLRQSNWYETILQVASDIRCPLY